MSKKWFVAMAAAAAMTASAGALAQAKVPAFYVGIDVGQTDIETVDDTDIGFRVLAGYQFHRNVAAELSYGMLYDKGGVEVTGFELSALGMFPVAPQFSLLVRLGIASLEADPGSSDTGIVFGFGAQYDVMSNLGVRLQWQRTSTDPEVDFLSLGAIWRF